MSFFKGKERKILLFALAHRILVWAISSIFNAWINDYDTSSDIILHPLEGASNTVLTCPRYINVFAKWDAVFFGHIAEYGYEFEKFHAFFPLLPFLMNHGRHLFWFLDVQERCKMFLFGIVLSNVCFVLSTVMFYRLTKMLFLSKEFSFKASIVYSLSPACVFLSAGYTEGPFSAFSMMGMVALMSNQTWTAVICFIIGAGFRSNATILIGFLVFRMLHHFSFHTLFITLVQSALVAAPTLSFQVFGNAIYCPGRPWCTSGNMYSFVQSTYWNVGFLRYYQIKQLPNFALCLPVTLVTAWGLYRLYRQYGVGLWMVGIGKDKPLSSSASGSHSTRALWQICSALYLAGLVAIGLVFMHVQVITRFVSSAPALYWFITDLMNQSRTWRNVVLSVLLAFHVGGVLLFPNFYPWS
eukprot:TRINITY_DN3325_c0_g1_i1.p1 TRINITY_DN3325_c0_g1~~TRINITY_DN3325_c0_g1_i1.p1  ORF type:complete len:412 (+),score=72.66 TRINITY_DN3325_c0_g1_i1:200-1435(+)